VRVCVYIYVEMIHIHIYASSNLLNQLDHCFFTMHNLIKIQSEPLQLNLHSAGIEVVGFG